MFVLYLSSELAAPMVLDINSQKGKQELKAAFYRGVPLYRVYTSTDRAKCITAWTILKENILSQLQYSLLN